MDLETVIQSKSEREKQISYVYDTYVYDTYVYDTYVYDTYVYDTCMWNLEKWYRWTGLQGRSWDTDVENKRMDTMQGKPWRWGGDGGVMNWVIGIDMYTLMCIKQMTNKNLLYKKINKIKLKKIF